MWIYLSSESGHLSSDGCQERALPRAHPTCHSHQFPLRTIPFMTLSSKTWLPLLTWGTVRLMSMRFHTRATFVSVLFPPFSPSPSLPPSSPSPASLSLFLQEKLASLMHTAVPLPLTLRKALIWSSPEHKERHSRQASGILLLYCTNSSSHCHIITSKILQGGWSKFLVVKVGGRRPLISLAIVNEFLFYPQQFSTRVETIVVNLLQLKEQLDPLHRHPGLHQSIDDPGKGIEGADQHVEQSHTGKHLRHSERNMT